MNEQMIAAYGSRRLESTHILQLQNIQNGKRFIWEKCMRAECFGYILIFIQVLRWSYITSLKNKTKYQIFRMKLKSHLIYRRWDDSSSSTKHDDSKFASQFQAPWNRRIFFIFLPHKISNKCSMTVESIGHLSNELSTRIDVSMGYFVYNTIQWKIPIHMNATCPPFWNSITTAKILFCFV